MAPPAHPGLAAGSLFLCHLALADSTVGFEAVQDGRRLTFKDYKFDTDLPPDRPVTDAQFFDDDFRQSAFQECGGKDKIEYKCEEGCTCEIADGNVYSKRCTPPKGKKTCSVKVAQELLSRREDKVAKLDRLVKTAIKQKEASEDEIKRWARKAVIAKKEAEVAEKALYKADEADKEHSKTQENEFKQELHELRTVTVPRKTREVWEKYAKVISEAQAKMDAAEAELAAASEESEKKKKLDDEAVHKLEEEVEKIEQKRAAIEAGAAGAEE
jgi:hypothetical protein